MLVTSGTLTGLPFLVALQPVVRDRLPGRRVGHERAPARSHAGIAVEGAHADAHLRGVVRIAAEEVGAALAAEALLEAAVRMSPGLDQLLAPYEPERAPVYPRLSRRGPPGATLAAGAVTVAGRAGGLRQLEAHSPAATASGRR